MTPTQRSLKHLRDRGYIAEVVEKWIPQIKQRKDLFGFVDIVGTASHGVTWVEVGADGERTQKGTVDTAHIVLLQTTSGSHVSARISKILQQPAFFVLKKVPGVRILVHGWSKVGPRGKRKTWQLREEIL